MAVRLSLLRTDGPLRAAALAEGEPVATDQLRTLRFFLVSGRSGTLLRLRRTMNGAGMFKRGAIVMALIPLVVILLGLLTALVVPHVLR